MEIHVLPECFSDVCICIFLFLVSCNDATLQLQCCRSNSHPFQLKEDFRPCSQLFAAVFSRLTRRISVNLV